MRRMECTSISSRTSTVLTSLRPLGWCSRNDALHDRIKDLHDTRDDDQCVYCTKVVPRTCLRRIAYCTSLRSYFDERLKGKVIRYRSEKYVSSSGIGSAAGTPYGLLSGFRSPAISASIISAICSKEHMKWTLISGPNLSSENISGDTRFNRHLVH